MIILCPERYYALLGKQAREVTSDRPDFQRQLLAVRSHTSHQIPQNFSLLGNRRIGGGAWGGGGARLGGAITPTYRRIKTT